MPDREKVIKGLQIERECVARDCGRDCRKCDLAQEWEWLLSVYDDALALLKEQEAKKPIYNAEKYGDYLPHCSSCEKVLPNSSQYGRAKFCYNCGQMVKWND